jgi:hypothetical protein
MPLPTLTVRVDVPEPPEMVDVLRVAVGPVGETVVIRVTVPVNPLVGEVDMVEVPELPACIVRNDGVLAMLKPGVAAEVTVTCTIMVLVNEP